MSEEGSYLYYVLFPNHHEGLKAHKLMKQAGLKCQISPTPRQASTSCGISLLIAEEIVATTEELMKKNLIKTEGIARIIRSQHSKFHGC